MQVISTSLQTDNHASTSSLSFLQAGCSSGCPIKSVKALKAPLFCHANNTTYGHSIQNRSVWRRSSPPIFWLSTEEIKLTYNKIKQHKNKMALVKTEKCTNSLLKPKPFRTAHVCILLRTTVVYTTAENSSDNLPSYPPDSYHCLDAVYWRRGGKEDG